MLSLEVGGWWVRVVVGGFIAQSECTLELLMVLTCNIEVIILG